MGDITATVQRVGAARTRKPLAHATVRSPEPTPYAYRHIFPFGVFCDTGTITRRKTDGTGTEVLTPSAAAHIGLMIDHPDSGFAANAIDAVMWIGSDTNVDICTPLENAYKGGPYWQVMNPAYVMDTEWFDNDEIDHTPAEADAIAAVVHAAYGDHPSVVAYNLWDDLNGEEEANRYATMAQALARVDAPGRPGVANPADPAEGIPYAFNALVANGGLVYCHHYPCGHILPNTATTEGDLRREHDGENLTFPEAIRQQTILVPDGMVIWMLPQAHMTVDETPNVTELRYPYPRELIMQAWLCIGEGAHGLFYFAYADQDGQWDGLGSVASAARMSAVSSIGHRLTRDIKQRIIKTRKPRTGVGIGNTFTEYFAASGGGNASLLSVYPNAYVATLYDEQSDAYYCVIVNHSLSTAAITVTGTGPFSGASGTLVNLETGVETALGASVSLGPIDGSIWRYQPL